MNHVIISDTNVALLFGKKVQETYGNAPLFTFPAGEENKTRETKQQLEDRLLAKGYGRDTTIVALGGGVVSDLAGYLAATYCRGVPLILIPTTLLAMVDASIGGKTGVNVPEGKNMIGSFYPAKKCTLNLDYLKTLPEEEFKNGLVEMIKHGIIASASHFHDIVEKKDLKKTITESRQIKERIVEEDEKERGLRKSLNFGHTVGHAIEKVSNYQISHGRAVAIGMIAESYLSMQLGLLSEQDFLEIRKTLEGDKISLNKNKLREAMTLDKKAQGKIPHFVTIEKIGKFHSCQAVQEKEIQNMLDWMEDDLCCH